MKDEELKQIESTRSWLKTMPNDVIYDIVVITMLRHMAEGMVLDSRLFPPLFYEVYLNRLKSKGYSIDETWWNEIQSICKNNVDLSRVSNLELTNEINKRLNKE